MADGGLTVKSKYLTLFFVIPLALACYLPVKNGIVSRGPLRFSMKKPAASGPGTGHAPLYIKEFVQEKEITRCVHSPSLVELGDGNILAVWYGGTREGAADVALYQSVWNRQTGGWSAAGLLTDAKRTQAELGRYVRKIGNPVLCRDGGGRIWLFYVSVSVGGWSGSAVNFKISDDGGRGWSPAGRLVTSPFLNMGTLVRNTPLLRDDGSIALPAYRELFCKFGELFRIGADGRILDGVRMTGGGKKLQPSVVPLDPSRAIAFLRASGTRTRRIVMTTTEDGGLTWSGASDTELPNPDSAVAALPAGDGTVLLVFNDAERARDVLALARSGDEGRTWKRVHIFEGGDADAVGFSYPSIIQASDGAFHLLYSWHRKRIAHVIFNQEWLRRLE